MSPSCASSPQSPDPRRRTFGPTVGAGLGQRARRRRGHQPWGTARHQRIGELSATVEAGRVPAANALALVVLACWGVLLVTRGRVRRIAAVIGVPAAVGCLVSVVTGWASAPDGVREATSRWASSDPDVAARRWYTVAAVAGLLTLATTALALRLVPGWPQMGRATTPRSSRPPAPDARPSPEERENLKFWKAIDEGRDPTD